MQRGEEFISLRARDESVEREAVKRISESAGQRTSHQLRGRRKNDSDDSRDGSDRSRRSFAEVFQKNLRETKPPMWAQKKTYSHRTGLMRALHEEVIDFCDFVEPPQEEHACRSLIIDKLRALVVKLYSEKAELFVFGSFETRLYLPHGDIDVVIMLPGSRSDPKYQLRRLYGALHQSDEFIRPLFISSARVPIVKAYSRTFGIQVDISMNMAAGISTAEFVKHQMQKYPALRPLALVLKMFLYQRDLNEVVSGGIGSYTIVVMLCCFLNTHPLFCRDEIAAEENLGVMLLEFFETFGTEINLHKVAIASNGFLAKHEAERQFTRIDKHGTPRFAVIDPLDRTNNLTGGAHKTEFIQAAFQYAGETLKRAVLYWYDVISKDPNDTPPTLLGYILNINPAIIERRSKITKLYQKMRQKQDSSDEETRNTHIRFGETSGNEINEASRFPSHTHAIDTNTDTELSISDSEDASSVQSSL